MNLRACRVFSICSICDMFLWLHLSVSGFGHCPAGSWTSKGYGENEAIAGMLENRSLCLMWEVGEDQQIPKWIFMANLRNFLHLECFCFWLFAADPPSKENPYEDIETNSHCLGKKCVLTFPASSTSSVPGTPTKVLWFKWPPLLLQKAFGWNPGFLWKKWIPSSC